MERKQVAFRLPEDLYRKLQMFALQQNTSVQDLLENSVQQLLNGGSSLSLRLARIIKELLEQRRNELKEHLLSAYRKSLRIDSVDKDIVIQVLINEFGELFERESLEGIVPNVVADQKGYILFEFPCQDVLELYYENNHMNIPDWYAPIEHLHAEFAEWLKLKGLIEEDSEDDPSSIVEIFYDQQVNKNGGPHYESYLQYMYEWNPKAFAIIKNRIRNSYIELEDEKLEEYIGTILKRPEIHQILEE